MPSKSLSCEPSLNMTREKKARGLLFYYAGMAPPVVPLIELPVKFPATLPIGRYCPADSASTLPPRLLWGPFEQCWTGTLYSRHNEPFAILFPPTLSGKRRGYIIVINSRGIPYRMFFMRRGGPCPASQRLFSLQFKKEKQQWLLLKPMTAWKSTTR